MHWTKRLSFLEFPELAPLWVAVFVDILGFSLLIPFLPFFGQAFGAPTWLVGLLLSTNALFGLFSGPIWGRLSDRYGRKPILLICQLGTLLGFLMLAFSRSMTMLFISRIIDGIFGGNYPIAKAIVGDVAPPHKRSEQMSNIGVAHVLSSLIGPGLGGLLSQGGIVVPGLFSAALSLLTVILTFFFVRESNPPERRVTHGDLSAGAGRVASRSIWKNATARTLLIQWGFHTMSFMVYISCISLFANIKLGLDARQTGMILMVAGVVRVFVRFVVFVPLLRRLGDRRTSFLGLGIFVVAFLLLGFVETPFQFVVVMCIASFAAGCTRGVLTGFLSRAVMPREQGQAMGLSASLDSLAQIVGPAVGGYILGALPIWTYGGLAAIFAFAAFLMAFRGLEFQPESYKKVSSGI
ncbi:MAG: MFS transporter [Anaerolineae bacterium]|nr:MFS transporter [Anaerolineae bacterium]